MYLSMHYYPDFSGRKGRKKKAMRRDSFGNNNKPSQYSMYVIREMFIIY